MKEQEKDILRGFSAGAAPTARERNLAAPERRDAQVGELCWPYRLAKDGGAEILGLPSPEPAGALTVPRQLDGHPVTAIADDLRAKKAVIVNYEKVEAEQQRRICDFINGSCYVTDGGAKRISDYIVLYVPEGVNVSEAMSVALEK